MTPEEQETIQKSNDPSVVMTVNGTTHTAEEAQLCVCGLDMCVQGRFVERITRGTLVR